MTDEVNNAIAEGQDPEYPENYDAEAQAAGITDINELDMVMEDLPPVDQEKLEDRMAYAPSMQPGSTHTFIFKLDKEKAWDTILIKGKPVPSYRYEAVEVRDDGSIGKTIRFQNATHFRSGKMESSRAEELLFALGKLPEYNESERKPSIILTLLQQAEAEQKTFRGSVQWKRYDKTLNQTWSTAPQKPYKKADGTEVKEELWPKGADGKFIPRPDDWEGNYGSETISRVMPTKDTLNAGKAARNGQPAVGAPESAT